VLGVRYVIIKLMSNYGVVMWDIVNLNNPITL